MGPRPTGVLRRGDAAHSALLSSPRAAPVPGTPARTGKLLLRNAPFVYAVQLRAARGQALGFLFGMGNAEARFTAYELSEPREAPRSASA